MNAQLQFTRQRATMVMPVIASPVSHARSVGRIRTFAWMGAILALLATGAYFRFQDPSESANGASPSQAGLRQVNVATPERTSAGDITLPATIQAYQSADLFARANGFLKAWHVEIGTEVTKGQVLAEIETPELDQELTQSIALLKQGQAEYQQAVAELEEAKADVSLAEANVLKARANVDFAVSQANRSKSLLNSRAVSREEYESTLRDRDARSADLESTKADLTRKKTNLGTRQAIIESRAAVVGNREANVQRLRDLTGFQKIVAPFDGIITRRNAEVGMLVTAGSNTGTRPLFSVAQIDVLRIQAAVPQSSALDIKPGDQVQVTIPEKPGKPLAGTVARTAGAVEPTSRSLLVEVELQNQDAKILPGVYAQIRFHSANEQAKWIIQANTVLMRSSGPMVVIVSPDNTLRAQKVTLGRDFGAAVEVLVGLEGRERLVVNPSDDLRDGQKVQQAPR